MAGLNNQRIQEHLAVNHEFAVKQGLTQAEIDALEPKYQALFDVLNNPEEYPDPVASVEALEFDLQEAWHFPRDKRFHKYQLYIKGCTCPIMDNVELIGYTEDRYSVSDCPWHWKGDK